jgi:hypothetical protein
MSTFIFIFIVVFILLGLQLENSHKKKRQFLLVEKSYFNSLSAKEPVFEIFKKGVIYYKMKGQIGNAFENVQQDFYSKYKLEEFEAILLCLISCAYNKANDRLDNTRSIKINEILINWKIDLNEVSNIYIKCSNINKLHKGELDYIAVFKHINTNKHKDIILLMCDILFSGKKLDHQQELILTNLSKINTESNTLIKETLHYYEQRKKAMSYHWELYDGKVEYHT